MTELPLDGVKVVSLAVNLPGPAAARRLVSLGASVTKVEPPSGDMLGFAAAGYYDWLSDGQTVVTLDLKGPAGRAGLDELLAEADLLLTSHRPAALERLGLGWATLQDSFPSLSQVAIVGHGGADADVPGHDLTYQAVAGTLGTPPRLPTLPVADLAGAERCVADAVALLFQASRSGRGGYREIALADVVEDMAASVRFGLSGEGAPLGGAMPTYGVYPAAQGYVAVAAIEPHFIAGLMKELGFSDPAELTAGVLADFFAGRTAEQWTAWGRESGLPVVGLS
ncbi:MAG TPA: CoA transferase [Candidatus Corynebacterium avicola]|uniref:CoA transferase n=1 Tax=Candidatus Corynebacterium avicola TaxID=2838527 RepID=A0A9D1ULD8_9CORY|nr:CoA transferase [Candidatus Corynebacterium avicola]